MKRLKSLLYLAFLVAATVVGVDHPLARPAIDPGRFTIDQVLSPAFPYNLVAARRADRIAWIENERGMRNVYTAVAPSFRPVRLTSTANDDGVDLRPLQISDDGAIVAY